MTRFRPGVHVANCVPAVRGGILVAILVLLVMVSMVGVGMMSTSQIGIRQSGSFRARQMLEYSAEPGLSLAQLRLEGVVRGTDPSLNLGSLTAICTPTTGADVCPSPNPSCPDDYQGDTDKDVVTQNAICNFMGAKFKGGRVSLLRRDDFVDGTETYATFLVNVIGFSGQRKRILQGGAVVRYLPAVPPLPARAVQISVRKWLND